MKKSLCFWQFAGLVFTSLLGTLLHFLYDWTAFLPVSLFSAVNESIWEHMKILFFPMLIFAFIESRNVAKIYKSFWCVKFFGITLGIIIIPTLYYTYTGALGVSADWFNVLIYYITASIVYIVETILMKKEKCNCISPKVAVVCLCVLGLVFMIFTFLPPEIPLFEDPITRTYGLIKNSGV